MAQSWTFNRFSSMHEGLSGKVIVMWGAAQGHVEEWTIMVSEDNSVAARMG